MKITECAPYKGYAIQRVWPGGEYPRVGRPYWQALNAAGEIVNTSDVCRKQLTNIIRKKIKKGKLKP